MVNVFLADGHFLSRKGLRALVEQEPGLQLVGEAVTRQELFSGIKETYAQVLVIDPDSVLHFKYDDLTKLSQELPSVNSLVVSSNPKAGNVFQLIDQGISSFVTKECSQQEIYRAILSAGKKERFFCNKVLELVLDRKVNENPEDNCDPTVLSERETEIVRLIAAGKTTAEIAERLSLSKHTISTHRKNILKKLNLKTPAQVINFAIKSSLVEA